MEAYAVVVFFRELKNDAALAELGYVKGTDQEFAKKWKISRQTLHAWRQPDSAFWSLFKNENLSRYMSKLPIALISLLKNSPVDFLRWTWPKEAQAAFMHRAQFEDVSGRTLEEMTDEQINAELARVRLQRKGKGKS